MSLKKIKTLLSVIPYKLSGNEMQQLRKKYDNKNYFDSEILPMFCLNEKGHIRRTEYHLKYIYEGDDKYTLFEATTADRLLDEEISNTGLDDLIKNFDLTLIFASLHHYTYDDFSRILPSSQYIVIELQYCSYFDGETTDYDMDVDVLGVIDSNLNFIKHECAVKV